MEVKTRIVTTVTSATTAPTERSIPPVIRTSNIPKPTIAGIVPSWSRTRRFPRLRKVPSSPLMPMSRVNKTSTAAKPTHGPAGTANGPTAFAPAVPGEVIFIPRCATGFVEFDSRPRYILATLRTFAVRTPKGKLQECKDARAQWCRVTRFRHLAHARLVAAAMTVSGVHSVIGRSAVSFPRHITARVSHTPNNSGR